MKQLILLCICKQCGLYDLLNIHIELSDSSIKTYKRNNCVLCPLNLFDLQIKSYLSDTSVESFPSGLWGQTEQSGAELVTSQPNNPVLSDCSQARFFPYGFIFQASSNFPFSVSEFLLGFSVLNPRLLLFSYF